MKITGFWSNSYYADTTRILKGKKDCQQTNTFINNTADGHHAEKKKKAHSDLISFVRLTECRGITEPEQA